MQNYPNAGAAQLVEIRETVQEIPRPPVLAKAPLDITIEEAADIGARVLTVGEDEFKAAEALARSGKKDQAVAAFERLRTSYRGSWIDRVSAERLKTLRGTRD